MNQIKKLKEQFSNSLKRRKELAVQRKDQTYIEQRIEDLCKERSSDEFDATIEDLLGKNINLHEEIINLKREKEIHSVRLCVVIEQKDKAEDNAKFANAILDEKDNEAQ